MSLREEWEAARSQRQEEIQLRQLQVQDLRDRTQQALSEIAANREVMAENLRVSLSDFHNNLQADVAEFLEATRSQQQQMWREGQQQRSAYAISIQEYVWGKAPAAAKPKAPKAPINRPVRDSERSSI